MGKKRGRGMSSFLFPHQREREEKDGLSDRGERRRKLGKMMIVSKKQSANNKNG